MKTNSFVAALALIMCTLSCSRIEDNAFPEKSSGRPVVLEVALPGQFSKSTSAEGESEISSMQVFIFREDGSLDAFSSVENSSSLEIGTTTGQRTIAVVANAPEISGVRNLESLSSMVSRLQDNSAGCYVMSGMTERQIVSSDRIVVQVSRLVARISVSSIANDFREPVYQTEDTDFRIVRIYVANAAGESVYFPATEAAHPVSVWYNRTDTGTKDELEALLGSGVMDERLLYGSAYEVPHYFYCYSNPCSLADEDHGNGRFCTRLVIETQLDGETYYYSIPVENVAANRSYNMTLRITRQGSTDPGTEVEAGSVSVGIEVVDWILSDDKDVTI